MARRSIKDRLKSVGQRRGVQYALSLPERILRSASAVSAGVVREIAEVALPIGIRRGRLYRTLVDASLRFLIEDIGRVEGTYPPADKLARDFLVRRTVGNGIDVMGVLAFHASPVWVLAALADVCGAGRELIPEIARSLKDEGLLAPGDSFATMEQVLAGLERTSAQLADTMNTPPLDVAGLREEWSKVAAEARRLPAPKLPTRADITGVWAELRAAAAEQNRSVFEVSSLLAISAVGQLPRRARLLSRSATLAARKSGGAMSEALLEHYRATLARIREAGFLAYGTRQLSPYVRAALKGFSPKQPTHTERLVRMQAPPSEDS
ncbi:MAG TPA: hypothetical protein VIC71_04250 [Gammaproteobacteria bacterium]